MHSVRGSSETAVVTPRITESEAIALARIPQQIKAAIAEVNEVTLNFDSEIARAIRHKKTPPCVFGTALTAARDRLQFAMRLLDAIRVPAVGGRSTEFFDPTQQTIEDLRPKQLDLLVPKQSAPAFASKAGAR